MFSLTGARFSVLRRRSRCCCSLCWKGLLLTTAVMGKREPLAPCLRVSGREVEGCGRGWQGARDREGGGGRWEAGGAPRHRRCGPVRCEGAWAGGRGRAWCCWCCVRMERAGGLGVVEGRGCCEVCGSPARCRCRSSSPRPRARGSGGRGSPSGPARRCGCRCAAQIGGADVGAGWSCSANRLASLSG